MHHFGVCGLANGLAVMRDEESESLWDHITGECFDGPLDGQQLEFWPVQLSNVTAEVSRHPETLLLKSNYRSPKSAVMGLLSRRIKVGAEGTMLAPHFRSSMSSDIDPRLPEGAQGLGLITDTNEGKFYPSSAIPKGEAIEDVWLGRPVRIDHDALDGSLSATWTDTGELPMQLMSRWYGFSFTYPGCAIYEQAEVAGPASGKLVSTPESG